MCFSAAWIEALLIDAVCIAVIFALLRLIVPFILTQLGVAGGIVAQAINIVLWGVICIFLIYFIFSLISCFVGSGLSLMPHR